MESKRRVGHIVILNGAPRAGKSSIAEVIQATFSGVWVNLGVDAMNFCMLPKRFLPGIGLRPGGEGPELEPVVDLLYAALIAYALLCSEPGSVTDLPVPSSATPISLEFSVSGDVSGTATTSTNIGWAAPCDPSTLVCRGAQVFFQQLTISDENSEWTGDLQLAIDPAQGPDTITGILVGRHGNAGQVLYLNEVTARSETSFSVSGYRITNTRPVGGVNLTFDSCLENATAAAGGFLGSHSVDDSGSTQLALARGIDAALGMAVAARFEGQHGTLAGIALERETTARGSAGRFVLLGGDGDYAGYLGFGRTGSQLTESDSCAGGYAFSSFWIGEVYGNSSGS